MSREDRWPVTDIVWTGPPGPVQLENITGEALTAIREELLNLGALTVKTLVTSSRPLYVPVREEWGALSTMARDGGAGGADHRTLTLRGYSPRTVDGQSPITARWARSAPLSSTLMQTPAAPRCPATMAAAAAIPGESERIRFLYLAPGSTLPKHRDPYHAPLWEDRKIVRFHIPIIRPHGCRFFAWDRADQCHEVCAWPGGVWFIDTDAPHMVVNCTTWPRIHLCIDKFLDPDLRQALEAPQARIEEPWDPDDCLGGI